MYIPVRPLKITGNLLKKLLSSSEDNWSNNSANSSNKYGMKQLTKTVSYIEYEWW